MWLWTEFRQPNIGLSSSIVEAKRSATTHGIKQCLLSLKDAREVGGGGVVYGFVTTGTYWQLISYGGVSFEETREFCVVHRGSDYGDLDQRWLSIATDWHNYVMNEIK